MQQTLDSYKFEDTDFKSDSSFAKLLPKTLKNDSFDPGFRGFYFCTNLCVLENSRGNSFIFKCQPKNTQIRKILVLNLKILIYIIEPTWNVQYIWQAESSDITYIKDLRILTLSLEQSTFIVHG